MLLTLVLLTLGHALLIKKCASLESEIPSHTDGLRSMMSEVRDLLDEALDLLADAPSAAGAVMPNIGQAESIPSLLLSTFLSRMNIDPDHASTQESQEWEVLEPNPTPTQ